jgi:ribonuclease HII
MTTLPSSLPHKPNLTVELDLWSGGFKRIAGIDEAGRGALAGPVACGAVILPPDENILEILSGVRDSKQMLPAGRIYWAEKIRSFSQAWGIGFASAQEIDSFGIVPSVHLAAHRALSLLTTAPDYLLLDYFVLEASPLPQTALVKGDCLSLSIACASVLAKTARDAWICGCDRRFPGYGFALHKGYGTAAHRAAIARWGISPLHRTSFRLKAPDI